MDINFIPLNIKKSHTFNYRECGYCGKTISERELKNESYILNGKTICKDCLNYIAVKYELEGV